MDARVRLLRVVRALLGCLALVCVLAPSAAADPILELGVADGMAHRLATGPGGSMWHTQLIRGESVNRTRVSHVDADGNRLSSTDLEGSPIYSQITPAADGGVWVSAQAKRGANPQATIGPVHVARGGAATAIDMGTTENVMTQAVGHDGRVWSAICSLAECRPVAASIDGQLSTYGALPREPGGPPFLREGLTGLQLVAVPGGMWIYYDLSGETRSFLAFVTYSGQIVRQPWGTGWQLAAAGPGDSVWVRSGSLPAMRFALLDPSGTWRGERTLTHPAGAKIHTAAGRGGSLLWALDTNLTPLGVDGALGAFTENGDWAQTVEEDATSVMLGSQGRVNLWGSTCFFGDGGLYQAADGSVWVFSFGIPGRITRRAPDGTLTNYRRPAQVVRGSDGMQPSSGGSLGPAASTTGALWFVGYDGGTFLTSETRPLARLNPLSPPAPELTKAQKYATPPAAQPGPARPVTDKALLRDVKSAVKRLGGRLRELRSTPRRAVMLTNFATPGTITATVKVRRSGKTITIAKATKTSKPRQRAKSSSWSPRPRPVSATSARSRNASKSKRRYASS